MKIEWKYDKNRIENYNKKTFVIETILNGYVLQFFKFVIQIFQIPLLSFVIIFIFNFFNFFSFFV